MKKVIILVIFVIILTGCSNVTSDVAGLENIKAETNNLFIEENEQVEDVSSEDEFVTYIDSINYHVEALTEKETVTVNEQNPQAIGFYEHMGFKVNKRTDLDEQGRPYPLLYMKR